MIGLILQCDIDRCAPVKVLRALRALTNLLSPAQPHLEPPPDPAPSTLQECQFPALALAPGWTPWPYTVAPLLAHSPFAPSSSPGGVPDLVHHLSYQGLPMDPVTSPRLYPVVFSPHRTARQW